METSAFRVRRARLYLGETQNDFAERFGVDASTVSRWERGCAMPSAETYAEIRRLALSADPVNNPDAFRASRNVKFLAPLDDLTHPVVLSKGHVEALLRLGYSPEDFLQHIKAEWFTAPDAPLYDVSGTKALRHIESIPAWRNREYAYCEFHGYLNVFMGWAHVLVAPMADVALVESVPDLEPAEGFYVRCHKHRYEGEF